MLRGAGGAVVAGRRTGGGGRVPACSAGDRLHRALPVDGLDGQHGPGTRRRGGPAAPRGAVRERRPAHQVPRHVPRGQRRCAPRCRRRRRAPAGRPASSMPPAMSMPSSTIATWSASRKYTPVRLLRSTTAIGDEERDRDAPTAPTHRRDSAPGPRGAGVRGGARVGPADRSLPPCSRSSAQHHRRPSAATQASAPLSSVEPGPPDRSTAWSWVSQVSTPLPTGVRSSSATRVSPAVTASHTYSKCGVPPRSPRRARPRRRGCGPAPGRPPAARPCRVPAPRSAARPGLPAAASARSSSTSTISACQASPPPSRRPVASGTVVPDGPRRSYALPPVVGTALRRESVPPRERPAQAAAPARPPRSGRSWPIRSRLVRR